MKLTTDISFGTVRFVDKLLFTKHLAVMVKSGVTLTEALSTLIRETGSSPLRAILKSVLESVQNGQPLSKALSRHPKVFDPFYTNLIEVSEESSSLDESLGYLAHELEKSYEFRKKVQGAMMYPAIVLAAAAVIGGAISIFVLPKLVDLFSSFDVQLPLMTRILIGVSVFMRDYGVLFFALLAGLFAALRALLVFPRMKRLWDSAVFHMPIIGPISRSSQLVLFCRNTGVMLKSGLTITKALSIQKENTQNLVFRGYIEDMASTVTKGKAISARMESGEYPNIPPIVATMVAVGEKTGKLDETLLYLGDFYEAEVDNATKNISTVLEPVLLICIALIVGFVALSIISPIYEFTASVKK